MENRETDNKELTGSSWVVAKVTSGKEDEVCDTCASMLSKDVLKDIFVPKHVRLKKYKGEWRRETRPLYSGYVFMVTDDPEALDKALLKVPGYHRLLKAADVILTVSDEEKSFINRIAGRDNVVEISTGYKEGDTIKIVSGPMMGLEGDIVHVDRHKRLVTINVSLFGRTVKTTLGLELTYKQDPEE
ncbi:MAG: antiterminator LoaP [Clostridiales bacterium]|nr:antiterminator LoaP [Clostridiales bacterium]